MAGLARKRSQVGRGDPYSTSQRPGSRGRACSSTAYIEFFERRWRSREPPKSGSMSLLAGDVRDVSIRIFPWEPIPFIYDRSS